MIVHIHMNADVFHALADPTRRRIVEVLSAGEQPVNELVGHAGIHQSGVSRHLRILQEPGSSRSGRKGSGASTHSGPSRSRNWTDGSRRTAACGARALDRFGAALAQGSARAGPLERRSHGNDEDDASPAAQKAAQKIVLERTLRAPIEDLWGLWTTKDGFESWWGPEGFRVEVHKLEARVGGALRYDMIADCAGG